MQARKEEVNAANLPEKQKYSLIAAYIGALSFLDYMENYWLHVAEDWCLGGRERAAAACGVPTQSLPNTSNHGESFFAKLKKSELPLYATSTYTVHDARALCTHKCSSDLIAYSSYIFKTSSLTPQALHA